MTGRRGPELWLIVGALVGACAAEGGSADRREPARAASPTMAQDAETLGREVFELVDRAVDYKGSHRGRPAASFRQMGIDTLTPTTIRRVVNPGGEPTVTVLFRKPDEHQVHACRGGPRILEDAALHGGRFTLTCTMADGAEQTIDVGEPPE